jgi:predicted esterase YcpF (UPF0227 family)
MKAMDTKKYFAQHFPQIHFHCPQLAASPQAVITQLELLIESERKRVINKITWLVMGSSLGGYFATYLSEKHQMKAVLINPAIKPFELLCDYMGEQTNPYTGETYQVEPHYIQCLKSLEQKIISKNNYLVMVQMGDEVLDYQQAVEKYRDCQLIVQSGGDHSFVDYQQMLPQVTIFFNI